MPTTLPERRGRVPLGPLDLIRLHLFRQRIERVRIGMERASAAGDRAGMRRWAERGHRACDAFEPVKARVLARVPEGSLASPQAGEPSCGQADKLADPPAGYE